MRMVKGIILACTYNCYQRIDGFNKIAGAGGPAAMMGNLNDITSKPFA